MLWPYPISVGHHIPGFQCSNQWRKMSTVSVYSGCHWVARGVVVTEKITLFVWTEGLLSTCRSFWSALHVCDHHPHGGICLLYCCAAHLHWWYLMLLTPNAAGAACPASMRCSATAVLLLGQRRRRCSRIKTTLAERLMYAGMLLLLQGRGP